MLRFLLMMWWVLMGGGWTAEALSMAKKGCPEKCGNVTIPYPFGIGKGCYYTDWYAITCNTTIKPSKPFLANFSLEVLSISLYSKLVTVNVPMDFNCTGEEVTTWTSVNLGSSPYKFSTRDNALVSVGCEGIHLSYDERRVMANCASVCSEYYSSLPEENCAIPLPYSLSLYSVNVTRSNGTCRYVLLTNELDSFNVDMTALTLAGRYIPAGLDWEFQYLPDSTTAFDFSYYGCYIDNTYDVCQCPHGLVGNPYLPDGCQEVRGCAQCKGYCNNMVENELGYVCHHDADPNKHKLMYIGLSVGIGSVLMLVGCYWAYQFVKRHIESRQRSLNFKRNGGMLLQQQMLSNKGVVDKTKVFTSDELDKATNHFNKNRILGQGGQGTVYKGMLLDGNIVAIKKSKKVDENQVEQFINEVVILSQINHRNIVKLYGCCLETEVPMLVYEFIPNGTLSQYISDTAEEFPITWEMRLQIAADVAGSLAYLHSASSIPIYHRDIKSSNILLDGKYKAKVADFGTSRTIDIDKTHLTTCVQGTFGYVDPQYFQSNQLTEKSDVYSFGVVLVELLTGKKPISFARTTEERSLVTYFLLSIERSSLFDIMSNRVLKEGREEEIKAVANLAKRCVNLEGKQRPTMKEVAIILEGIRSNHLSSSMPPSLPENETLEIEIRDIYDAPFTSSSFSLNSGPSSPIDNQPRLLNTI